MKKHKIELSYKDLHAIKHALQDTISDKLDAIKQRGWDAPFGFVPISDEEIEKLHQDITYEKELLFRFVNKIDYIKDKYKI
jgi:hypothetical protein